MALIATIVAGNLQIGDQSAPDHSTAVSGNAGTIDWSEKKKVAVAAGGKVTVTPPSGTKIKSFWCKVYDANGDPGAVSIEINNSTAADIVSCSECFIADYDAANQTSQTQFEITELNTAAVTLEYVIAGLSTD